MRKHISLLGFAVLAFLFISCDLADDNPGGLIEPLTGEWNWERTYGGFIGETITPDSVDYTLRLIITEDAEAFLYRNDSLTVTYDVTFGKADGIEESSWIFWPRNQKTKIISFISEFKKDKLVLQDACADCYTLYFSR